MMHHSLLIFCLLSTVVSSIFIREINDGFHYVTDRQKDTFLNTWTWCEQLGGHLPSVHSASDINFLNQLVGGSASMNVWLGGKFTYNSNWLWSDGSPFDYTSFYSNPCTTSCCGLMTYQTSYIWSIDICVTTNQCYKVCRLNEVTSELLNINHTHSENIQALESNVSAIQTMTMQAVRDSFTNITDQMSKFSVPFVSLTNELQANTTNVVNKLMLDTMSETSLRLRLLETSLNHSMTLASQSLATSLTDFQRNASQMERLMQELRASIAANASAFMTEAENMTWSRIAIMDMFLNNSSLSLNSSLEEHSDIVQTVLHSLKDRVEQDFKDKSLETDRQLDQMTHRMTMLGMTILILPLFFLLVMIFRRERGMGGMGKANSQRMPLNDFSTES